jgi:aminocarboxymuconate-semialdehyde decarboxylase
MPGIDVHTHMFTYRFMELLDAKGGIHSLQTRQDGLSRSTLMQLISS